MKFKANFVEKPINFQMDDCHVENLRQLTDAGRKDHAALLGTHVSEIMKAEQAMGRRMG